MIALKDTLALELKKVAQTAETEGLKHCVYTNLDYGGWVWCAVSLGDDLNSVSIIQNLSQLDLNTKADLNAIVLVASAQVFSWSFRAEVLVGSMKLVDPKTNKQCNDISIGYEQNNDKSTLIPIGPIGTKVGIFKLNASSEHGQVKCSVKVSTIRQGTPSVENTELLMIL